MKYKFISVLVNLQKFIVLANKIVPKRKLIGLKQDKESLKVIIELHIKYPKLIENIIATDIEKTYIKKFLSNLDKQKLDEFINQIWIINKRNILKSNYDKINKIINTN